MDGDGQDLSTPPPALDPLEGAGEPLGPFPGPDLVVGSYRRSLVWPALTTACGILSVFFFSLILGPIGIICGLIGFSRAERFSRTALAFAVACMLAGLILHALTHNHHSLTTGNYYFD